jgi:RNA polymerase sigma-70 factor (ECF subfamily)
MTIINLRNFYPWYESDELIEVPDEVAGVLFDSARLERNYTERVRYNKSFYSLDTDDGIEREACYINMAPHEVMERELLRCRVCKALNSLPEPQGRRVEAHFLRGKRVCDIARAEGVVPSRIYASIERGLRNMKNFLK